MPRQRDRTLFQRTANRMRLEKKRPLNEKQKVQVKRIVNRKFETKFNIFTIPSAIIGTPGTPFVVDDGGTAMTPLLTPPQNTTDTGRIGDRISLKKAHFKYHLMMNPNAIASVYPCIVRLIIFQWKPSTASVVPTPAQLLLPDPATSAGAVISVYSDYNYDLRHQYKIIHDRMDILTGEGFYNTFGPLPAGTNPEVAAPYTGISQRWRLQNMKLKKAKRELQFNAGTTLGDNQLHIFLISNTPAASANTDKPAFFFTSQLFYTDA